MKGCVTVYALLSLFENLLQRENGGKFKYEVHASIEERGLPQELDNIRPHGCADDMASIRKS